jgi:hypothetical protein
VTLKGLLALDINIEALFIQLYNTFSFRTSIELFTNSLDGEEKTNLPLPKELPSRTKLHGRGKFAKLKGDFN